MGYITFDKSEMVNLSFGLSREVIRTNRAGAYGAGTIIDCNTRKYHGYLVAPQPQVDGDLHVLLSSIDEVIIQNNKEFRLSVHRFTDNKGGCYFPKGHKYIKEFNLNPVPSITYSLGGLVLKKERMNTVNDTQCMIRYTLLKAQSDNTVLRLSPLLAFRNRHSLSKANPNVSKSYEEVNGGIKYRMYSPYSYLYFQLNKEAEYTHAPDWHYNFEYEKDKERGYDYVEDLFNPGYFDVPLECGKSVIISIATEKYNPKGLSRRFNYENKIRVPRNSFLNCLINGAQQFIVNDNGKYKTVAGYPWLGEIPRDAFIALPGLSFAQDKEELFKKVINGMLKNMNGPFFSHHFISTKFENSADASLWFVWAIQQYADTYKNAKDYIKKYWWKYIKLILESYKKGIENIFVAENNLLYQGKDNEALTWMNAYVDSKPVTQRKGFAVEINALWYNAIKFALSIVNENDKKFIKQWSEYLELLGTAMIKYFYDEDKICLCDNFEEDKYDWTVRPNQLIAVAMKYTPFNDYVKLKVLESVEAELLTPVGIRTLSPRYPQYLAKYEGSHNNRGYAKHNGPAYTWLIMFYIDTIDALYNRKLTKEKVKELIEKLEPEMSKGGLGTLSEVYNGNPPYEGSGTISQAVNVSAVLWLMFKYLNKKLKK